MVDTVWLFALLLSSVCACSSLHNSNIRLLVHKCVHMMGPAPPWIDKQRDARPAVLAHRAHGAVRTHGPPSCWGVKRLLLAHCNITYMHYTSDDMGTGSYVATSLAIMSAPLHAAMAWASRA